jgi:hypothetical protein
MAHGTRVGLARVLLQVTAIVVIPVLGGTVAGIVADRVLGTSPVFVFSGFAVGNLLAAAGTWLYIRVQLRRMAADRDGQRDEN